MSADLEEVLRLRSQLEERPSEVVVDLSVSIAENWSKVVEYYQLKSETRRETEAVISEVLDRHDTEDCDFWRVYAQFNLKVWKSMGYRAPVKWLKKASTGWKKWNEKTQSGINHNLVEQAEVLTCAADYESAMQLLRAFLQSTPEIECFTHRKHAILQMAQLYQNDGQYAQAIALLFRLEKNATSNDTAGLSHNHLRFLLAHAYGAWAGSLRTEAVNVDEAGSSPKDKKESEEAAIVAEKTAAGIFVKLFEELSAERAEHEEEDKADAQRALEMTSDDDATNEAEPPPLLISVKDVETWINDATTWRTIGEACAFVGCHLFAADLFEEGARRNLNGAGRGHWFGLAKAQRNCGRRELALAALDCALEKCNDDPQLHQLKNVLNDDIKHAATVVERPKLESTLDDLASALGKILQKCDKAETTTDIKAQAQTLISAQVRGMLCRTEQISTSDLNLEANANKVGLDAPEEYDQQTAAQATQTEDLAAASQVEEKVADAFQVEEDCVQDAIYEEDKVAPAIQGEDTAVTAHEELQIVAHCLPAPVLVTEEAVVVEERVLIENTIEEAVAPACTIEYGQEETKEEIVVPDTVKVIQEEDSPSHLSLPIISVKKESKSPKSPGKPYPLPDVVAKEYDARCALIVDAVKEAQASEVRRDQRLKRAKSKEERHLLERRYNRERKQDAQRIRDLNQERNDFLRMAEDQRESMLPNCSVSSTSLPVGERSMPASDTLELQFYKSMYTKLDKAPKRKKSATKNRLAATRREPSKSATSMPQLRQTRQSLLRRLENVNKEEDALRRMPAISSPPRTAASNASSNLAAFNLRPSRPHVRPSAVPQLRTSIRTSS